jgi:hypothetical protein
LISNGFKKYAVEIGSAAMICNTKFHKQWYRHSKVDMVGTHGHTDKMVIAPSPLKIARPQASLGARKIADATTQTAVSESSLRVTK